MSADKLESNILQINYVFYSIRDNKCWNVAQWVIVRILNDGFSLGIKVYRSTRCSYFVHSRFVHLKNFKKEIDGVFFLKQINA